MTRAASTAALLSLLLAAPAHAAASPAIDAPRVLIEEWTALNSACRGGRGDDPATWKACDEREIVGRRLKAEGWCFGRKGELQYQKLWHRCAASSLH